MSNHYHLLVKTPEGNLGRVMRHINGQYTQRYNRLRKTDGPLFRGRYKAILVEEDSYQLQLSRYIHRNPVEAGLVERLEAYPWSSYPCYITSQRPPDWLYREEIYQQLSARSRRREKYWSFVESGTDDEIATFYSKGNQTPYLGSDDFRDWAYRQTQTDEAVVRGDVLKRFRPSLVEVAAQTAECFCVDVGTIIKSQRGRTDENIPRWVFMHIAQEVGGQKLCDIAEFLGLSRAGSIPTTIAKLKFRMREDSIGAKGFRDKA